MIARPLLTLSCLCLLGGLAAQDPTPTREAPAGAPPIEPRTADGDGLLTVRFPGGSLTSYVQLLRTAAAQGGTAPNIVLTDAAEQVVLPSFEIHDVDVSTALELAEELIEPPVRASYRRLKNDRSGRLVHLFRVSGDARRDQSVPTRTIVMSLRALTTLPPGYPQDTPALTLEADQILSAVEAGLQLEGGLDDVQLAYHESSGILFCRAAPSRLVLVEETISRLETDLRTRRDQARAAAGPSSPFGGSAGKKDG